MNLKQLYLFFLLLLGLTFGSISQNNPTIDSLKRELITASTVKNRFKLLYQLGVSFEKTNNDSCLHYNLLAEPLSIKTGIDSNILNVLNKIAHVYHSLNNFDTLHFKKYHQTSIRLKDTVHQIESSLFLASFSKYKKALNHLKNAKELKQATNDSNLINYYTVMAMVYEKNNQINLAIKSYYNALEGTDKKEYTQVSNIYNNLSLCYTHIFDWENVKKYAYLNINLIDSIGEDKFVYTSYLLSYFDIIMYELKVKNYKKADSIINLGLQRSRLHNDNYFLSKFLGFKSKIEFHQKNYNKALIYNDSVISIALKNNDIETIIDTKLTRCDILTLKGEYAKIINLAKYVLKHAHKTQGFSFFKPYSSWILYENYKNLNKNDSALKYYENYINEKNIERKRQNKEEALTQEMSFKHQQERLNDSLQHQKELELKSLAIQNEKQISSYKLYGITGLAIILFLFGYLFYNKRQNKLKQEALQLEQESLVLEQKMLRAQLNPHFLSNSLGAIQSFILKNDKLTASDYLADFSHLTRLILESSREDFIPLEDEVQIIKLYLSFQKLRLQESFNYNVLIDKDIDLEIEKIPPMLLQPFIENAIEHGLKNQKNGFVEIIIKKVNNNIKIDIKDNGIGLVKAEPKERKSYSSKITTERIVAIKKRLNLDIKFSIKELKTDLNTINGTLVSFHFTELT